MKLFRSLTGCALILALTAAQAQAEIITPLLPVTNSSEFADADNLVNGSGLDGVGPILGQLHDNDENNMWQTFAGDSAGESVTFELDKVYDLSGAHIWQYNGPDGNGDLQLDREVDEFELAVSPDLVSPFVSIGTFNLATAQDQSVAGFNEPSQAFALAGANNVRRVQLTINSVQGGVSDGFAGLSEVRFEGTAIPEPTTLALAVGGLSISLGLMRRRKCRT